MAMTRTYLSVNGRIISEHRSGEAHSRDYILDPLGNVMGVYQADWAIAYMSFDPWGELLSGWNADSYKFAWVGGWGYRRTGLEWASHYVRARHYSFMDGSWTTVDPLWPGERAYGYVEGRVTGAADPPGLSMITAQICAFISRSRGKWTWAASRSGVNYYVENNNYGFGGGPLSCKLFVQVRIDSCSIGNAAPGFEAHIAHSTYGSQFLNGPIRIVGSYLGKLDIWKQTSVDTCTSRIDFRVTGQAGVPSSLHFLYHVAPAISIDGSFEFRTQRDYVKLDGKIGRTSFPDFEYRVNIGGKGSPIRWEKPSAYSLPHHGLIFPGVTDYISLFEPAQGSKRCCGTC